MYISCSGTGINKPLCAALIAANHAINACFSYPQCSAKSTHFPRPFLLHRSAIYLPCKNVALIFPFLRAHTKTLRKIHALRKQRRFSMHSRAASHLRKCAERAQKRTPFRLSKPLGRLVGFASWSCHLCALLRMRNDVSDSTCASEGRTNCESN